MFGCLGAHRCADCRRFAVNGAQPPDGSRDAVPFLLLELMQFTPYAASITLIANVLFENCAPQWEWKSLRLNDVFAETQLNVRPQLVMERWCYVVTLIVVVCQQYTGLDVARVRSVGGDELDCAVESIDCTASFDRSEGVDVDVPFPRYAFLVTCCVSVIACGNMFTSFRIVGTAVLQGVRRSHFELRGRRLCASCS